MPSPNVLKRIEKYIVGNPNSKGEARMLCPLHGETGASASVNVDTLVWHCMACNQGGTVARLIKILDEDQVGEADYDPFATGTVTNIETGKIKKEARKVGEYIEPLTEAHVTGWCKFLFGPNGKKYLAELKKKRGLNDETIRLFEIGFDLKRKRFTIPIRDDNGALVNVRKYDPNANGSEKTKNSTGWGSPARLFPIKSLANSTVIICEGELDALTAIQNGFNAVSGTHGASTWDHSWNLLFKDKKVFVCYDNDAEGKKGAEAIRSALAPIAEVVVIPPLLPDIPHSDVTDFFLKYKDAKQRFENILREAESVAVPEDPIVENVDVKVIGSMDSRTNGKQLAMNVTVIGRKDPTFSVPHVVTMACNMDAGPKCRKCPMATLWEGEHQITIKPDNVEAISKMIAVREEKIIEVLRAEIEAQKCNRLGFEVDEAQTVEELFVMSSLDRKLHEEADYTQRRIYNIGRHKTQENSAANVIGTTIPSPVDRRNEFFSWDLKESVTSLDNFKITTDTISRLSIFNPSRNQTPLDKLEEIADDLSVNVTKIYGRNDLHIAMDLVWHSALHFPLDGKIISRGWLEFIVVGDTRTGKSETAIRLSAHYGLGHVVGCEGATFAGLVGAVKQISNEWTITWGEITVNDRRLVVLDEATGLSQEIISLLSDVRSRGRAQLTKADRRETDARCRLIWIANQRPNKYIDERAYAGIDMLQSVIGAPEDIARFDFAMSVDMNDVSAELLNNSRHKKKKHTYTSELCNELILWVWSRKPNQIEWQKEAYDLVYKMATIMGEKFHDDPPLIQRTNAREKIARLAVAVAGRLFSTEDGETLIVKTEHVEAACEFLERIYSQDNFGYLRRSKRIQRNREIARSHRKQVKRFLKSYPRLLEFFLDKHGESFRSPDLEEMAHMTRDEVSTVLGYLSDTKMIKKDKSQIMIEPELYKILKEMEDE
jgi:hypothetical protein